MKLYESKEWLRDRYVVKRMDLEDIGKEAGCSGQTIYNWLKKYDLIRNARSWK